MSNNYAQFSEEMVVPAEKVGAWDQCPLCENTYPIVVPEDQVMYCPWCGGELLP